MISVVMPYWNRSFALSRALGLYDKWYADMPLEIIVVDDGSRDQPYVEGFKLPIRVIRLPEKDTPLCPCVPINAGVAAANGDVIVLTNPEILHHKPVLQEMHAALVELGPDGYVAAAAFCRERNEWHCHSERQNFNTPMPPGAGLHFCAMLHRGLWDRAGGFDEDYRAGAGYDDNDWVWRLHRAGARFLIRDDLRVEHPKSGARVRWPFGGHDRNALLFNSKWPELCGC